MSVDPYREATEELANWMIDLEERPPGRVSPEDNLREGVEEILRRHFPPPVKPVAWRWRVKHPNGEGGYYEWEPWELTKDRNKIPKWPADRIMDIRPLYAASPPGPGREGKAKVRGAVETLERIQERGYYLHDREGKPVSGEEFLRIVTESLP